ncbi:hypothetical protein CK203_063598 [Vitis vinifera]|uniref:Retrotransposon gag domain-containing protein n=1 Tax=Vitis vinifera TaxID=29760 RepID=A0A438G361_VITVI|nr:hypothetical protein CK203_063598 [Vitis vinifera]
MLVSPYFQITSLSQLFLIGFLNCLGVIPNYLPSTKPGFGITSSERAISMFGSTMEMTDIRAMKTCIALRLLIEIDLSSRAWIKDWVRGLTGTTPPVLIQGTTPHDSSTTPPPLPPLPSSKPTIQPDYTIPPPPPLPVQSTPQAGAFVLHGQTVTTPHSVWPLHRRDTNDHVVPSVPKWCHPALVCFIGPSRRRTWTDLAQEFLRQYSFNIVVDVSRRELEALRQRLDETVTSFISRWREKIA